MRKSLWLILLLAAGALCAGDGTAETPVRTPLDQAAAVAMAERHFVEVYGERVLKQRPWQVTDTGDAFFIKGTLRHGSRGGTATMWLRKSDGLILELIHYK